MKPYKRNFRNYLIDKQFQTKYLLLTVLMLSAYTLVFIIILFTPSILSIISDTSLEEKAAASRTFLVLHGAVWPTTLAAISIFSIFSIFLTHKIAGPVYRLKYAMTELMNGNLDTRIYLRRWDDLQELATEVNLFSDDLRQYIVTLKNDHERLSSVVEELEKEVSTEAGYEMIRELKEQNKSIALTLEHFTSKS